MSFRNYESLKLGPTNYKTVGFRFAFAALFYLILFLYFFNKNFYSTRGGKDNIIEQDRINNEEDNDKTENFLEGRL